MERGEHVILFNDLPTNAVSGSIRVEGKATGRLEIGSVDTRRVKVPSTDEAVAATERKRIEDAIEKLRDERAQLSATVEAAEAQKTLINNLAQLPTKSAPANGARAGAARLGAALRHDRPAHRRGAEDHPRHADQDPRDRPADPRPGRQAGAGRAHAAGAHRGQGVRQRRRRRSRPISSSATRSPAHPGRPSTTRAWRPARRRRRRSCSWCVAPASSSAPARSGTTWRCRCRRRGRAPAPRLRSSAR